MKWVAKNWEAEFWGVCAGLLGASLWYLLGMQHLTSVVFGLFYGTFYYAKMLEESFKGFRKGSKDPFWGDAE